MSGSSAPTLSAATYAEAIMALANDVEREKLQRYFKTGPGEYGEGDQFLGVRMAQLFDLAKQHLELPPAELDQLLLSPWHEIRAGALSVMDKQARRKRTPDTRRAELYELYLRRLDRINNWDLVDLAAIHVVGGYLRPRSRAPLYDLARSSNMWARRTAIVATAHFLRTDDDVTDTLAIAELLLHDPEDLVHKATGGWLREASRRDPVRHRAFLDKHAPRMPRVMLRYATEYLPEEARLHYRKRKA
ncbi:3-methyladenine DNA glycosylase AlkD [Crossiella equi]|uniref:3-methyladenine DNA glycosylase AlkD n=1 Tax=Crossiella equi TaxID=130796 RepID=A0ABS5ARB0_9PSEU|nr:DNA alkylation repair protein [Crossiella equi]MBP2478787.1 3-methyladenine DNA glycosylase AlkD [Crossiella equi]